MSYRLYNYTCHAVYVDFEAPAFMERLHSCFLLLECFSLQLQSFSLKWSDLDYLDCSKAKFQN